MTGRITWVTALMFLLIAAAIYLGWAFGPVYVDHYEVKRLVHETGNLAATNSDDSSLRSGLLSKLQRVGQVLSKDGLEALDPGTQVDMDSLVFERQESTLHVAFKYTRRVTLPLLGRRLDHRLSLDERLDVRRPVWDK